MPSFAFVSAAAIFSFGSAVRQPVSSRCSSPSFSAVFWHLVRSFMIVARYLPKPLPIEPWQAWSVADAIGAVGRPCVATPKSCAISVA